MSRFSTKINISDTEVHRSMDSIIKIVCTNTKCNWSVIWHQFGLMTDKHVKCDDCGAGCDVKMVTNKDYTRLGGKYGIREKSSQTHYYPKSTNGKIHVVRHT